VVAQKKTELILQSIHAGKWCHSFARGVGEVSWLKALPLLFIHDWLTGAQYTDKASNFFQSLAFD